jgi:diguanylate cyclase (GGDEF)-like protein
MIPRDGNSTTLVLGVLTPHTGGFYYGTVINGILRAAREHGVVAVAFETSRLNLLRDGQVLGDKWVDGWLAINEFVDPNLLAELRLRNRPVIHVHSRPETNFGACVLPDNEDGSRAITAHLIQHGHRRIAFAGNLVHIDIAGRYAGYCAALAEAGIKLDESIVFDTPHHKEVHGEAVASELLELRAEPDPAAAPVTALVAATDRLALGAMTRFTRAGLTLPDDFAIVGFDDTDAAQFAEPALTTVRQSFAEVAAAAVLELLTSIRESRAPARQLTVPTRPILRRSCGCLVSQSTTPELDGGDASRAQALVRGLLALGSRNRRNAMTLAEWPAAARVARLMDSAARQIQNEQRVRGDLWSDYLAESRDAESAVRVMELLESTLHSWHIPAENLQRSRAMLRDLRVALMHEWQRAERIMVSHYEAVTETAYRLANALAAGPPDPARDLSWIRWSNPAHACCALWGDKLSSLERPILGAPSSVKLGEVASLYLTGEYSAGAGPVLREAAESVATEAFPPATLLESALREGSILTIASVPSGRGGDFGLLAVVAPLAFEQLEYVGTPGDWAVHLGSALDRSIVERTLRANAELDTLTGLANRTTLLGRVEELLSIGSTPTFAILFIDLDDFKKINDSLGHKAGDQLLVEIADRLLGEVAAREVTVADLDTPGNLVARVGGDEFVVVLTGVANEAEVAEIAEHLQRRLKQPHTIFGSPVFVSASIGVTFGHGSDSSAHDLLRDADTAMYRAKMKGRARHEVFHHRMHKQAVEKLHLDAQLRSAIEQNELELWYQPIVDLSSGNEVGAEALIRWRHPEQGLLTPARFLAVAEDVGLAVPMSEWVIRRACQDSVESSLDHSQLTYVNVNVPAAHIKQADFVDFVESALSESGLNPRCLGIELVESALLDEPAKCASALSRLMAKGVRIAIDDFGTGYSSLSYLRDFPVNTLKIDRSFIKNIPGDARDNGITRAIIAMGQGLGLSLVAEGIETLEQLQFLRDAGCPYAQGYFLCVPLELAAYRKRLGTVRPSEPLPSSRRIASAARAPLSRH